MMIIVKSQEMARQDEMVSKVSVFSDILPRHQEKIGGWDDGGKDKWIQVEHHFIAV